ncbi:TPA: YtxH domain-containing protein [Candidatus Berkelbacteria bacterium]|uniref:Gas vesicle protein n=1 Tax=Berkelbacteria bacterium GW2011_GWE1_39_12 TaxID=1618337 RepID=A0A0G4B3I3_9BACT|nr:MAG: hypothetical protein UT28_C0001G0603 [Berkelbacteria bacterium GW2011_GWE1_39_12]HBO60995.1 YtxH domain-containing protein [Candidatus Berkelbacteria bacterium]
MKKEFFIGLMIGLISGATAGILLAPKKGEETQRDINDAMANLKTTITGKIANLGKMSRQKFNEIIDSTFDEIDDLKSLSVNEKDELKEKLKNKYDQVREVIEG